MFARFQATFHKGDNFSFGLFSGISVPFEKESTQVLKNVHLF